MTAAMTMPLGVISSQLLRVHKIASNHNGTADIDLCTSCIGWTISQNVFSINTLSKLTSYTIHCARCAATER